jgi:NAD(P)-dependent dehydrogenase (short-subunit alcohol dehydrogenase family)
MRKESTMKLHGGHVVVIGGSRGIGLAAARLATDAGAEVTIAGPSQEKLIQAQRELEKMHTVVMDLTDESAVGKVLAGVRQVGHGFISAGTIRHGTIVTMTSYCRCW